MYSPDLATECQVARGPAVRAIGWLAVGHLFAEGDADAALLAALGEHLHAKARWLPFATAGVHFCDLGGCERAGGAQHIVIPSATCVYVAPDLIKHYVEVHRYAPPAEFVTALHACPPQSSAQYVELLIPFADVWNLDERRVRAIAERMLEMRR